MDAQRILGSISIAKRRTAAPDTVGLFYPARSPRSQQFPGAHGGVVDLTRYPFGPAHEDFVIALETANRPLG